MMPVVGDIVLVSFWNGMIMTGNVIEILDGKTGMFPSDTIRVEFKSSQYPSSSFIKRVSEHQILRIYK